MYKIQLLNTISTKGLSLLPANLYEADADMSNPDAILLRSHDMHAMEIPSSVKAIGRAGAGVNNIPIKALTQRGIPVFNTPGANANAVCELVIAAMLLGSRHLCEAWLYVSQLQTVGKQLETDIEQGKKQFVGSELIGKTLGIVGLGSIGVKVANAAISLGMHVIGYDPTITVNRAWELSSRVQQAHHLDDLLAAADFVTFHVPLIDATRNMINTSRLSIMKKGAVLLNFARDGIIDKDALLERLKHDQSLIYITDFPCALLKNHPRVISLPHLGASTHEAEENCAVMIVKQIRDFLEYGTITNSVNFPNVDLSSQNENTDRFAIVNANVPNMVAQVSSVLAKAGLNISSLFNQSRDDIAYTVIDITTHLRNELLDSIVRDLQNIDGVLQVRLITQAKISV